MDNVFVKDMIKLSEEEVEIMVNTGKDLLHEIDNSLPLTYLSKIGIIEALLFASSRYIIDITIAHAEKMKELNTPNVIGLGQETGSISRTVILATKLHDSEIEDQPGNYSYDIIPFMGINKVEDKDTSYYDIEYNDLQPILDCALTLAKHLTPEELDGNTFTLEITGSYILDIEIEEDDYVNLVITPDGAIKRLIKDDASIEK